VASQPSYPSSFEPASLGEELQCPDSPSGEETATIRHLTFMLAPNWADLPAAPGLHRRCAMQGNKRFVYLLRSVTSRSDPTLA